MTEQAPEASNGPVAVELRGITKRFPGVIANHDIDITVRRGTVHAIVGENGAGKSTLMKTLYGMHRPDEGTIAIDGKQVVLHSPADAIALGVGMVHQHFQLADNFTVIENVVLGQEPTRAGLLDVDTARQRILAIGAQYGLTVDPDALVEHLGVGDRQRVEIIKVLYRGARILILDEPTAVLVPQEVDELFSALRELKSQGLTVIFISHKLDEVLSVADEITVIRAGTTVATVLPTDVTARELAHLMVGSELPSPETRESTVTDNAVLVVEGLGLVEADRPLLSDLTFTIHAGEVVGIAGVEGNGQAELVETIMGIRTASSGTVTFEGGDITRWSTRDRREAGIGYIPEDRSRHGLLLEAPLWENRMLGHQTQPPNARGPFIDIKGARSDTRRIVEEYDVRTPSIDVTASALSGGNQQKLIVGREMSGAPRLLIAAHPTRGVDVGAQAAIWDLLRQARAAGLAVLLISADLDELIGLSDTLRVLLRGRLVAEADPATVTPEELGSAMTGAAGPGGGSMTADRIRRIALGIAAPVLALLFALAVTSVILAISGHAPLPAYQAMWDYGTSETSMVNTINLSITYYLAAVAAAIGFRMNLFNIGVDGQYRIAALLAAAVGGVLHLPGFLDVAIILIVAMIAGAAWAAIAGLLKARRGVSEVISTIMLNYIATGVIAYLLTPGRLAVAVTGSNNIGTRPIPPNGQVPGFSFGSSGDKIEGLIILAVVVGFGFWFVLGRTRFGYDLRATGRSEPAAVASGVNVKRMIVMSMILSGAVAGLVGMPQLLGEVHSYGTDFPTGLGFTGISIALLGRNNAIGMVFGALLWAFLDTSRLILDLNGISKDVVTIMQGITVLSVVVAYELVRRYRLRQQQQDVGRQLGTIEPALPGPAAA